MTVAARLGDPIEHSSAFEGLIGGLVVGAIAGLAAGAAIVATGGLAAGPIIAAVATTGLAASAGGGLGEVLGGLNVMTSTSGQIVSGVPGVKINGLPAARAQVDFVDCSKSDHNRRPIAVGSAGVFINGFPAARAGDATSCDAKIASGASGVTIGGGSRQLVEIEPEVPVWLENTVAAVGIGSAVVLFGPIVASMGLIGGVGGGYAGQYFGGEIWGEGSDGQTLAMLGGSVIGGGLAGRAGTGIAARAVPNPTSTTGAWARHGMTGTRTLPVNTTNGVVVRGDPAKTTTVIGSYRSDTESILQSVGNVKNENFGSRPGDFQLLNTPDHYFRNGPQFWREYNEPWLRAAVQRGDRIIVATPPKMGANGAMIRQVGESKYGITGFGREYLYLRKNGYTYDATKGVMTKP